jgi:hypothetical protein
MIELALWQRDTRPLLFDGRSFQRGFGEDAQASVPPEIRKSVANKLFSLQIWETLGYQRQEDGRHLIPPDVSVPSKRALLLRAWVELSAWVAEYLRNNRMSLVLSCCLAYSLQRKAFRFGKSRISSSNVCGSRFILPKTRYQR